MSLQLIAYPKHRTGEQNIQHSEYCQAMHRKREMCGSCYM